MIVRAFSTPKLEAFVFTPTIEAFVFTPKLEAIFLPMGMRSSKSGSSWLLCETYQRKSLIVKDCFVFVIPPTNKESFKREKVEICVAGLIC